MSSLRVATLNLWGRRGPWPDRLALIRAELDRLSPRLVGMQEVMSAPEADQATEIADGLGYAIAYSPATERREGGTMGNALLSDLPIREHRTFALPTAPGIETRALLYARVATEHGDLPVFVTHLDWQGHHGAARLAQVRFIVARAAELAGDLPPVIMGDFNAEPDSDEIRHLRGLHIADGESVCFADAWIFGGDGSAGETFSRVNDYARQTRVPSRRIDYIFTGDGARMRAEPLHTEVVFRKPQGDVWPSDHFGLMTDLTIGPR